MSSEEMRTELERFVNTGLREGWTGWPLKADICSNDCLAREWSVAPARVWLRQLSGLAPATRLEGSFTSLHSLC